MPIEKNKNFSLSMKLERKIFINTCPITNIILKIFFMSLYKTRSGSESFGPIENHLLTLTVIKM